MKNLAYCLNPCFNGRYSQRGSERGARTLLRVLILVLMEDTLRGISGFTLTPEFLRS